MPTYQYECTNPNCKKQWEEIKSVADRLNILCGECGEKAEIVITLVTPKHFSWASWSVDHNMK